MRIGQLGYLVALALAEIVGDFAYERYANTGLVSAFGLGTLGYIGVVYFLIKSLAGSTILYVNGMWDGISTLLESLAAMVFLGEGFERAEQYVGLAMIIGGLVLVGSRPTRYKRRS